VFVILVKVAHPDFSDVSCALLTVHRDSWLVAPGGTRPSDRLPFRRGPPPRKVAGPMSLTPTTEHQKTTETHSITSYVQKPCFWKNIQLSYVGPVRLCYWLIA